jgi:hypothetical protein
VCGGEEARGGAGAVVGHADVEEGEAVRFVGILWDGLGGSFGGGICILIATCA